VTAVRPRPCTYCPYKRSTPSGVWSHEDYEKLRPYDRDTWDQPTNGFSCHVSPHEYCCGWAATHSNRAHEYELLALRIRWPDHGIPDVDDIDLFASGNEAADHGQADLDQPSPDAVDAINNLIRRHGRLRDA
jgi:hypothetical protein